MAESTLRFLMLWMTVCALLQTPDIQAQSSINASILPSATSPFSSGFFSTPWNSSFPSQSNSAIGFPPSSADQHSSSALNVQSSQFITSDTITSQATEASTIAPTTPQLASSTVTPSKSSVTPSSSPTTEGSKDGISKTTEWILIGCLGAFGLMFIAIIILVVQIIRLNKSVNNLKITSSR